MSPIPPEAKALTAEELAERVHGRGSLSAYVLERWLRELSVRGLVERTGAGWRPHPCAGDFWLAIRSMPRA